MTIYDEKLDLAIELLQKCQRDNKLDSCFKCAFFPSCKVRKEYVDAVYVSMNKGKGGGFEF